MEYKEWLKSLKPGDMVAIETITGSYVLRKVSRLTKTQIVLDNCQKFYISSGLLVGGSFYYKTSIVPITAEMKESLEKYRLIKIIKKYDLSLLNTSSLMEILFIMRNDTRP